MSKIPPSEPDEDVERDIADDPFLSAVSSDLERVSAQTDRTLLVALVLVALPAALSVKAFGVRSLWVIAALATLIVGAIVLTLARVVRLKRRVAIKHGLVCSACGHMPRAGQILEVATLLRCGRCRLPLRSNSGSAQGDAIFRDQPERR